jgi:hypothetical protein
MWQFRAYAWIAQTLLLASYRVYFPAAIRGLCLEPVFRDTPGLAGLSGLPWESYFSWGRIILAGLVSIGMLEMAIRLGAPTRDGKVSVMIAAFALFYMAPPLVLTRFHVAPAWEFWALTGIAHTIISISLYGQLMFPLGHREVAEFCRHPDVFKEDAARVRAIATVMNCEHAIAQMALTIAVALTVSLGAALLGNVAGTFFSDVRVFVQIGKFWLMSLTWLVVGYIFYFVQQTAKASQLSEVLQLMLCGCREPYSDAPPNLRPQGAQPYAHGYGGFRELLRRLGRMLRRPIVAAIVTLLCGFVAYSVPSLIRGTFFWNSWVSFPVLKIVTITVGDSLFMPVICALIMWFIDLSEHDLSNARRGNLGEVAKSAAVRITPWYKRRAVIPALFIIGSLPHVLMHYIWINDPFTGFMDEVVGRMTLAGWIHLAFSVLATCFILYGIWKGILFIRVAGRASTVDAHATRTLRVFTTFVFLLCVFQGLEIIDFFIKTFLINHESVLRSLLREEQVLFSLIPLLIFFPIVRGHVGRVIAKARKGQASVST